MKRAILLICFLFAGLSFAQERNTTTATRGDSSQNPEVGYERPSYYNLNESSDYTFKNQNFRFTPDEHGINIFRIENNEEIPVGKLRRTTADGFYIMTSTVDPDDIAFGRFDRQGNFRTYKYDRSIDQVTEEDYYNINPRDIRGDNRSDRARERSNNERNRRKNSNTNRNSDGNNGKSQNNNNSNN